MELFKMRDWNWMNTHERPYEHVYYSFIRPMSYAITLLINLRLVNKVFIEWYLTLLACIVVSYKPKMSHYFGKQNRNQWDRRCPLVKNKETKWLTHIFVLLVNLALAVKNWERVYNLGWITWTWKNKVVVDDASKTTGTYASLVARSRVYTLGYQPCTKSYPYVNDHLYVYSNPRLLYHYL